MAVKSSSRQNRIPASDAPAQQSSNRLRAASFLLVLLAACGPAEKPPDTNMNELNGFASRYAEAWSSQDPAAFALFYTDDGALIVNGGAPSVGRDAIEQTARDFMTAFPDMVVRLVELERSDDRVIFHWHWTGTNTGPGGNGNAVDLTGYEVWFFDDSGLIRESRGHYDEAEYRRQMDATKEGRNE
jgi:steroid delta-isomerase-like uncharacterized protein